jgi:hypothetical protein
LAESNNPATSKPKKETIMKKFYLTLALGCSTILGSAAARAGDKPVANQPNMPPINQPNGGLVTKPNGGFYAKPNGGLVTKPNAPGWFKHNGGWFGKPNGSPNAKPAIVETKPAKTGQRIIQSQPPLVQPELQRQRIGQTQLQRQVQQQSQPQGGASVQVRVNQQ